MMPSIKQLSKVGNQFGTGAARVNWFPGHMYSGMKAMMGKLNTVDCVIEVHDARIPFSGRNTEFRQHLGLIKPHILVLNKSDLADLSRWDSIKQKLNERNDKNIFLTDLTGTEFSFANRGYTNLMDKVVSVTMESEAFNRTISNEYRVMIVGIPNVGKSTLINRLRQHHLGIKGSPAKSGPEAGVTRHVDNKIKICSRPLIYSIDTPGVLEPGCTKDAKLAMPLALCSTINDRVLNVESLVDYLLRFLNKTENFTYLHQYDLDKPLLKPIQLTQSPKFHEFTHNVKLDSGLLAQKPNLNRLYWQFINDFRKGLLGKVIFN